MTMNIVVYSLICYGITAVISFLVIALVVLLNNFMSRADKKPNAQQGEGA